MNMWEERESTRAESVAERHCNRKKDGIPNAVLCLQLLLIAIGRISR